MKVLRWLIAALGLSAALPADVWLAQENKPYTLFITELYTGIWSPAVASPVTQALGTTDWCYWPLGLKAGLVGRNDWGPENYGILVNVFGSGASSFNMKSVEAELDLGLYERQVFRYNADPQGLSLAEIRANGGRVAHSQVYIPLIAGVDLAEVHQAGNNYSGTGGSVATGLGARYIRNEIVFDLEFFYRFGFGGEITGSGDSRILASGKPLTADSSGAAFTFGIGYAF
jgi:hypothetical protein